MDIKCKTNPYYFYTPYSSEAVHFRGMQKASSIARRVNGPATLERKIGMNVGLCEDKIVRRPVANKNATGLFGLSNKYVNAVKKYVKNYKNNITHTIDHKIVYALVEKELFGKYSINSITHDLDKLVLYMLGLPKPCVSKIHRQISTHHAESGKKSNLKSMLCDNIASSPQFKPEKKLSLRDYFASNKELQKIDGLKEILEKYNYGEDIDFKKIMTKKAKINNMPRKFISRAKSFCAFLF